jgi:ADP-ribosylglycohydrolase
MTADITLRTRFQGCLLGGAVGDPLGAGIEFTSLNEICGNLLGRSPGR